MSSSDHLDRLVAALPIHTVAPTCPDAPTRFPTWRWPIPRPYNGFTGIERVRGWQLSRWLEAAGSLPRPRTCSICKGHGRPAFHSESYYHIGRAPTLCPSCHRATHRRQREWKHWRSLVVCHAVTGEEWFCFLARYPVDLAGHLRRTQGEQVRDLLASPTLLTCPGIPDRLPSNLYPTDESGAGLPHQSRLV